LCTVSTFIFGSIPLSEAPTYPTQPSRAASPQNARKPPVRAWLLRVGRRPRCQLAFLYRRQCVAHRGEAPTVANIENITPTTPTEQLPAIPDKPRRVSKKVRAAIDLMVSGDCKKIATPRYPGRSISRRRSGVNPVNIVRKSSAVGLSIFQKLRTARLARLIHQPSPQRSARER
jgi:hypothetical protein